MIQNFLNLSDEKLKEIDYMIERLEKDHPLRFTRLEKDLCEAVMEVKPEMLNFYEMVYGGQTYNLMDVVAGVANICGGGYGPTVSGNVEYVSSSDDGAYNNATRVVKWTLKDVPAGKEGTGGHFPISMWMFWEQTEDWYRKGPSSIIIWLRERTGRDKP